MKTLKVSFNPIPTSQGRNQPLYELHMTESGRNRVEYLPTYQMNKFTFHIGFLAPAFVMIVYPPDVEEGGNQEGYTNILSANATAMTIICFFVATANIWPLVVAWKARKEIIDIDKQEEPAQLDNMENMAQISSTIPQ